MKSLTNDEIDEGIESGKWHWAGGVGGCGNQHLVSGRDPGPFLILSAFLYAAGLLLLGYFVP